MKERYISILLILLAGLALVRFFFVPFRQVPEQREVDFIVRVRLASDKGEIILTGGEGCVFRDIDSGEILLRDADLSRGVSAREAGQGIRIGNKGFLSRGISISPGKAGSIGHNGRRYRGAMEIIRSANGLMLVNRVPLESYLKGVVPREMNSFWPMGVLEAQSIVSRSYAVYRARRRKNKEYDLTADTYSQVYGGRSAEKWRTNKAVDSTAGEVLEYDDKILPAYFHSCCGGHTENISRVWGGKLPPLRGIRCPWCKWSPYFRWQARVSAELLNDRLKEKGYDINGVDDIQCGKRDRSGRLMHLKVLSGKRWFEFSSGEFRAVVGRGTLKSANFRVKKMDDTYVFSGYGWGHGVGMCQWGAFHLGVRRWSAEKILRKYYPGSRIVQLGQLPG